jgi:hypothetical protein
MGAQDYNNSLFTKATNRELQGITNAALAHPTASEWRSGEANVRALRSAFRILSCEVVLDSGTYTIIYRKFKVSYGVITKAFVSHTRQPAPCGWLNIADYLGQ